jgi:hypothetical protein
MLQQQQQYNNQTAQIAGQPSGLSNFLAPVQRMMMAQALRGGGTTERPTGLGYDQNGQNPYSYSPQGPDYSQNVGNLISTRD